METPASAPETMVIPGPSQPTSDMETQAPAHETMATPGPSQPTSDMETPASAPETMATPGPSQPTSDMHSQGVYASSQLSKKIARTPEEQKERDAVKYKLLSPCNCQKKCLIKIPEEQRQEIHSQFWNEEYSSRRAWLFTHVKTQEPT